MTSSKLFRIQARKSLEAHASRYTRPAREGGREEGREEGRAYLVHDLLKALQHPGAEERGGTRISVDTTSEGIEPDAGLLSHPSDLREGGREGGREGEREGGRGRRDVSVDTTSKGVEPDAGLLSHPSDLREGGREGGRERGRGGG